MAVDASVLANALTDDGPVGTFGRSELARDTHWAGPEHLVVEVFSAVRGRWLGGKISEQRARDALAALTMAAVDLLPTRPLLERMWDLRSSVSGYAAAHIAVAETLDCPSVTADARLGRASDVRCEIRVALPTT